jgi:fluoroacetyl-CoA thioesterase
MRQIPLGARGSYSLLAQPEHLANRFKDATLPPVLATPVMIMVMENAAPQCNRGLSRSRRERVGTAVNVRILRRRRLDAWLLGRLR